MRLALPALESAATFSLRERRHWAVYALGIALFILFHFWLGGHLIRQTHLNRFASDQQAQINLSRESQNDLWPQRTDGVNNPLWSWTARVVSVPDDEAFFTRGKWLNVTITAVFLAVLAAAAGRLLPVLPAVNLVILASLGALLPRAVLFQPEPLYYICIFCAWVCACAILARNRLWLYALFGLAVGFAYLAKPSSMPFVLIFILVTSARFAWAWLKKESGWSVRNHAVGMLICAVAAGAVLAPRMMYAQRVFNDPFHHLHKYWTWMDPGPEKQAFHDRYNSAMRTLTPDQRPSPVSYFRTHTGEQAWQRFSTGVEAKFRTFFKAEKKLRGRELWRIEPGKKGQRGLLLFRGIYLILLFALLAALAAIAWRRGVNALEPSSVFIALFAMGVFTIYVLATGWHHPFAAGDRFMLAFYLPLAATLVFACDWLRRRIGMGPAGWTHFAVHAIISILLAVRVVSLTLHPEFPAWKLKYDRSAKADQEEVSGTD